MRRRLRDWAEREGYSRARGYLIETRTVARDPRRGKDYRELNEVPARERRTRPEYGIAVRLVKDRALARRRLRRHSPG
ncbi:MAG: hypothetical protein ACRDL4_08255 [Thermoleophilaceae bacterium]